MSTAFCHDVRRRVHHRVSVVIPMYNEEENAEPMIGGIARALAALEHPWELIVVDDGSTDRTQERVAQTIRAWGNHMRLILLQRNFGQTAAMQAGIDSARGDIIVVLDGDLQNDPTDIPDMVARLLDEDLDLVAGWRRDRRDNLWLRNLPSRIGNVLIGLVTGIKLHDYGCGLKVYRASAVRNVRLYGDMHRFMPAWIALHTSRRRIAEHIVRHHARRFGRSKYGINRVLRVGVDLLSVYFFLRFRASPAQFFGRIGLTFMLLGGSTLGYLSWRRLVFHSPLADRPMFLIGILLAVMSVQFLTTGVLSELLSRTYYESSRTKSYTIRGSRPTRVARATGWRFPSTPVVLDPGVTTGGFGRGSRACDSSS